MKKLALIIGLALLLCVASVSALGVSGAIVQKNIGQGSSATHTMTVWLSSGELETDMAVDVSEMSGPGVTVTVDKPTFHIVPGQSVPVVATITVAPDALLGLSTGSILIHSITGEGQGVGFSTAISVPVKITVCEPRISQVSFTGTPTYGVSPLTVQFTGIVVGGGPTQTYYKWEYAQRINDIPQQKVTFSTEQNPQFTFTELGKYDVYFTAGNLLGSNSQGAFRYVTVAIPPTPTPTPVPTTPVPTPLPTVAPTPEPTPALPVYYYYGGEQMVIPVGMYVNQWGIYGTSGNFRICGDEIEPIELTLLDVNTNAAVGCLVCDAY